MSARWVTFLVWAAVAASATFWALRLWVRPAPPPPQAVVADAGAAARGDLTRLLGADPPPPAASAPEPAPVADARFQLVGVVSPRGAGGTREGVALIAVDGNPARAYRVGTLVAEPHVLKQVSARGATLGPRDGPPQVTLELPPLPPAATGSLPPAVAGAVQGLPGLPGQQGVRPMPTGPRQAPQLAPAPAAPLEVPPQQMPPGAVPSSGDVLTR